MQLLNSLRRKSARRMPKDLDLTGLTGSEVTEKVEIDCPPPPTPSPSSVYVSRCSSLASMDSMAAALALTPVTLDFASSISNSSTNFISPPEPYDDPLDSQARVAPLVATTGPTNLRSNIRSTGKPRRSKRERPTTARGLDQRRDTGAVTQRSDSSASSSSASLVSQTCGGPASTHARDTGIAETPAFNRPSSPTNPSATSAVVAQRPARLDSTASSSRSSLIPLKSPTSPKSIGRRRSSADSVRACFAPKLASKPAFSPPRLPVISPTGSSFGGDSMSPTFSFFNHSDGSRPRRSIGSLFASDDSPVEAGFANRQKSAPSWTAADIFAGASILLDSPTSEVASPASPCGSSRVTSSRLIQRRPVNLDLTSAKLRPKTCHDTLSSVSPSPSPLDAAPRDSGTPRLSPEMAASKLAPQDVGLPSMDGTASIDRKAVTMQWVLCTPPETPPEQCDPLPRVKPLFFPLSTDGNEIKEYMQGARKLSAVVEGGSPP